MTKALTGQGSARPPAGQEIQTQIVTNSLQVLTPQQLNMKEFVILKMLYLCNAVLQEVMR